LGGIIVSGVIAIDSISGVAEIVGISLSEDIDSSKFG
jgi:hypothetical protein